MEKITEVSLHYIKGLVAQSQKNKVITTYNKSNNNNNNFT